MCHKCKGTGIIRVPLFTSVVEQTCPCRNDALSGEVLQTRYDELTLFNEYIDWCRSNPNDNKPR